MVRFGWLSPVAGHAGSHFQPIVMYQEEHILPQVLPHFDSVWIADHFYGFDSEKKEGFLEGWTTLTWLAAKYPDVMLCHHVLGHGYRNPEHPTFSGTFFQIHDAAATPRPEVVPPICIGSSGEKIGLPIVGRHADIWNGAYGGDDDWKRKRDIVDGAAVDAGRSPADIDSCVTVAGDLPDSDAASEQWLERLTHLGDLGVTHFVMDFGHPLDADPALRFAEQVIAPMRAS